MKKTIAFGCILLLCVWSCTKKKAEDVAVNIGLDYYPVIIGKYIIYSVDSVVYNDLRKDTTIYKSLLKEKIADAFTDNTGQTAYRIERYIKKYNPALLYDSMPWTIKTVYMMNANNKNIQIQEGNNRFCKLSFPVLAKNTWNGNAFNSLGEQTYKYDYVDNAETINNKAFTDVCLVIQKAFHPLTLDQNYVEKYAKGVGLVYKEITDVVSNSPSANFAIPVLQRIESGSIYKQTFLSIGYE